jgi:hypothetical protein
MATIDHEMFFGLKAQPFSQPWATPRGIRYHTTSHRPNGSTDLQANRWAVDPEPAYALCVPLGVAQGWENHGPFGAIITGQAGRGRLESK